MTELRAGLIGLGMMGRHHARVLRRLGGVELVGVADPMGDPHDAAQGLPRYDTVEELIGLGIDYCVVAAPTAFHEKLGLTLAEAGVHTLIEKPLAQDVASSRRVVDAFEAAGLVGAVGHIERYNPALQQLRVRLEEGQLGNIFQVVTRRQGPFPNRISDVGVVKDLGTHDIDLTAWVTGQPYRSVSARTAYKSGREYEDLVAVVGQLADGTITNHLVNWLSPMKERITIVTGERGCLIADTLNVDLTFHNNAEMSLTQWEALSNFRGVSEGDMIRYAIPKPEPLQTEHEAFRNAVLGKEADIVTMRQGLVNVVVAQAMLDSAASGTTVAIEV
ncbi:MAG: Gfo/Idh/MocA family oxidoreductase [Streptomycetaceae bacterium]|nr:Gfo/Idh/MocA family oxidoreductase [Streptomycetaceae bacterium]